jgi:hypothetical protein
MTAGEEAGTAARVVVAIAAAAEVKLIKVKERRFDVRGRTDEEERYKMAIRTREQRLMRGPQW